MYVFLLVIRLLQTCFIVMLPAGAQASVAMLFSVVGFVVLLARKPYRNPSKCVHLIIDYLTPSRGQS